MYKVTLENPSSQSYMAYRLKFEEGSLLLKHCSLVYELPHNGYIGPHSTEKILTFFVHCSNLDKKVLSFLQLTLSRSHSTRKWKSVGEQAVSR